MQVERISADITLKHKPRTGTQAYNMLIESLKAEIQEKQEILSHLSQDKVKQKFIENWKHQLLEERWLCVELALIHQ